MPVSPTENKKNNDPSPAAHNAAQGFGIGFFQVVVQVPHQQAATVQPTLDPVDAVEENAQDPHPHYVQAVLLTLGWAGDPNYFQALIENPVFLMNLIDHLQQEHAPVHTEQEDSSQNLSI